MYDPSASSADTRPTAYQGRRRSAQLPLTPKDRVHRQLPFLFGGHVPGSGTNSNNSGSEDELQNDADAANPRENFLGRVQSYSKLMHRHTRSQLDSPKTGTLPSYTKTMHSFTLNQLNHLQQATKSATNSPKLGVASKSVMLPAKLCQELGKLSLDELPHGPVNTPEHDEVVVPARNKRRSLTEPTPRDFAITLQSRDLAAA